jgi:hypothetical protein
MPGLLSGSMLRSGGSGKFIKLSDAMPQLPATSSTSTGYTLITTNKLVTYYASSLGNIEFNSGTMYVNNMGAITGTNTSTHLQLIGTGTLSVIVSGGSISTNTNTGALVIQGGLGVWGDTYIGGHLIANVFTATTATVYSLNVTALTSSTDILSGAVIVAGGVGVSENVNIGQKLKVNSIATFSAVTSSTDILSGAVIVAGGVGIGGNVNIGQRLNVGSTATFSSDVTIINDTNVFGELNAIGHSAVNLSPQAASVTIEPTLGGTITIQPSLTGHINDMIIGEFRPQNSYFLNSYANNFIGLATTSTNIDGGNLGSIPYQTSTGTTAFIGIGPNRTVLISNGTTATWASAADLSVSTATNADNVFINQADESITTDHYIILSTSTNQYGKLVDDAFFTYNADFREFKVTTVKATASIYSREGNASESNLLYVPISTLSVGAPPANPRLGDFWVDPSQGATFQFMLDGSNKVWVQFTGL